METAYESMYPNGQQVDFIGSISGSSSLTLPFSSYISNAITTSESSHYPHFKKSVKSERESPPFDSFQRASEMTAPSLNGCSFNMQKLSTTGGNGVDSYLSLSDTHRGSPLLTPLMHQQLLHGMDFNSSNFLNCRDLFCRPQQALNQHQEQIPHTNVQYPDSDCQNPLLNASQQCMSSNQSTRIFASPNQNLNMQQANFDYSIPSVTNSSFNGNRSGNLVNGVGNTNGSNLTSHLDTHLQGGNFNLQPLSNGPVSHTSAPSSTRKNSLFWNTGNIMSGSNGQTSSGTPPFITSTPIKDSTPSSTSLLMFPGNEVVDPTNVNSMEYYFRQAQERGFIVGVNLDKVLQRSSRCASANNNKILNQFKNRYGEVDSKTRCAYLHLGVRVPSKEHVSEIVGKGGTKIRNLRDDTGALITTPGEQEDHVFIIEAPPPVALQVAMFIQQRSDEITQNKVATSNRRLSAGGIGPIGSNVLGNTHRRLLARDKISVPQDLVGKIIGTQGSIITTIQKDTGTEIRSPPKDLTRDPRGNADFEIAIYEQHNLNSETARQRIYKAKQLIAHLVMRQYEKMEEEEHNNSSTSLLDLSCGSDMNWPSTNSGVSLRNTTGHRGSLGSHDPPPSQLLQQTSAGGSGHSSTFHLMSYWKWPEIEPMNHDEAREVIDRILVESKNKTRKESSGSPELGNVSCGTTGGNVFGVSNTTLSQQPQRSGHSGLNMITSDYSGGSGTLTGGSNPGYYSSNANRTLPNFLNSSFDEPRDIMNATISTTDGSDILRNACNGNAVTSNNFGIFGQWSSDLKNNNCFSCGNQNSNSFEQSSDTNGHFQSNNFYQRGQSGGFNSTTSSMDALSTVQHNHESALGGGMGLMYPSISITYPSADGSIRGLDALSQQLSQSLNIGNLNFHQMRNHRSGENVTTQSGFPPNLFNLSSNFQLPAGSLLSNFSGKRNQENFKVHNDSGFESTGNIGYQQNDISLTSGLHTSIPSIDLHNSPIKLDFLEHHSLLFDKSNPWRNGSSSHIDPLIESTSTIPPTPEKVGIIGDGRKKTPSPTQTE